MAALNWSRPVSDAEMRARTGGRRAYNARRAYLAAERRRRLVETFGPLVFLLPKRGQVTSAAQALGVSRFTIWRDCRALRDAWHKYLQTPAGWRQVMGIAADQGRAD